MEYNKNDVITNIKNKITEECQLVTDTAKYVDSAYFDAVKMIMECKGKIVITGVGKSGHIGKKLAASFSCIGTPTFFVHSCESLHGDIGVIEDKDVVIMISNSGKTDEVISMIPSLKILGCKTIAITRDNHSKLAKKCDVALCVKVEKEIDHLNLAPTSSALAVLAVGDAIAVTVSELKGFTKAEFAVRHPLGALGQQLLKEHKQAQIS